MCQSHHWLDFKQRGFTTNHHMQDTNGDSLLVVVGHPLTCGIYKNHFEKIWSHPVGFLVKMHKHLALQGLHFQQKLRFQGQSHGWHHWLFGVFPIHKSGLIVVLMPWTLIFKTFNQSAWELVNLRGHVPVPPLVRFQAARPHHKPSHARHSMVTVFLVLLGIP